MPNKHIKSFARRPLRHSYRRAPYVNVPVRNCRIPVVTDPRPHVRFGHIVLKSSIRVPRPRVMLKFRRGECSVKLHFLREITKYRTLVHVG